MQLRAERALHAMRRPGPTPGFEGDVVGGMPILGCNDELESGNKPAGHGHHLISLRHGEGAPRAEIVLYVYKQKRGVSAKPAWSVHSFHNLTVPPARSGRNMLSSQA